MGNEEDKEVKKIMEKKLLMILLTNRENHLFTFWPIPISFWKYFCDYVVSTINTYKYNFSSLYDIILKFHMLK